MVSYIKDSEEFSNLNLMDLLFETYVDEIGVERNRFEEWLDENKQMFFEKTGLKEEDFYLDNEEGLDRKHYQSALYDTIREVQQGIEGLYHNLNY